MESGNRTDNMERRIAPDGMTEDGKKESEAIDRRVEELMAPEEDCLLYTSDAADE